MEIEMDILSEESERHETMIDMGEKMTESDEGCVTGDENHEVIEADMNEMEKGVGFENIPAKKKTSGRSQLVIHNTAWKSWIPAVGSALLLVSMGIFFLFVQFEAWTVHSIVSLVLVANGLVLLMKTRKETCTFDQAKGKLTIRRTTWRGRKVTRHWLMQIKEVRVEEYKDPQGGTDYELYLFLRSGQRVKIFSGHLIGVGSKRKLQARDEIVEFLEEFSKKYTTKSRASHSGLKGYMKKQLSGALMPKPRVSRRRGRSSSFTRGQDNATTAGVGLAVPESPSRERGKRHRSVSLNPGTSPPTSRSRSGSDAIPPADG